MDIVKKIYLTNNGNESYNVNLLVDGKIVTLSSGSADIVNNWKSSGLRKGQTLTINLGDIRNSFQQWKRCTIRLVVTNRRNLLQRSFEFLYLEHLRNVVNSDVTINIVEEKEENFSLVSKVNFKAPENHAKRIVLKKGVLNDPAKLRVRWRSPDDPKTQGERLTKEVGKRENTYWDLIDELHLPDLTEVEVAIVVENNTYCQPQKFYVYNKSSRFAYYCVSWKLYPFVKKMEGVRYDGIK
ncbi:MAG: hypothetical protein IK012_01270 [Fibrobacter sp.]|uniref:hypothetical protein n=1 Tax=Fibrobacter sp. TaxID=35828 RepID=UPI0025C0615C|nr:hypothetical protein [Fibrobacter sp.]MBR4783871.1 hypothetical protein [Fibrobacter sp.]